MVDPSEEVPALSYEPCISPYPVPECPPVPTEGIVFHHGLKPRTQVPPGCSLWFDHATLDRRFPYSIPLNQLEYINLGYLLGFALPWNRRSKPFYPREAALSLIPSASPNFASWSSTDGGYDLDIIMAGYKRELSMINNALSLIWTLARTHQRPTPFALGTQFTVLATPHTEFKIRLSRGSHVLTQRIAKGKEIDTSENHIFKKRLLALYHHQLVAIFSKKGFASLSDRALIHAHLLTLDRHNGLSLLAKAFYRRECEDSAFGVGTIFPSQGFAYCENTKKDSTLWRVRSDFSYLWHEDFVLDLPFITIHFMAYNPLSFDEVQALQLTTNSLLQENHLLHQQNELLIDRNRVLSEQVTCLTEAVRRRILP